MRFILKAVNSWDDYSHDSDDPYLTLHKDFEAKNQNEAREKAKVLLEEWLDEKHNHRPDADTHHFSAELLVVRPVWEVEYDKGEAAKPAVPAKPARPGRSSGLVEKKHA